MDENEEKIPEPPEDMNEGHITDLIHVLYEQDLVRFHDLLIRAHAWANNRSQEDEASCNIAEVNINSPEFIRNFWYVQQRLQFEQLSLLKEIRDGLKTKTNQTVRLSSAKRKGKRKGSEGAS